VKARTASLLFLILLALSTASCGWIPEQVRGYTDENVPSPGDFDRILKHDLTEYVTDKNDKDVSVTYEMLRDGPTQSGVALPKFYIWIEKHAADGSVMEQAAARIAAVKKEHFDIIQYYNTDQIRQDPTKLKVFPDEVQAKIRQKIGLNEN
jgi:hypothetical protein